MGQGSIGNEGKSLSGDQVVPQTQSSVARTRIGVDLIKVKRIAGLMERYGARFLQRVFTERELAACGDRPERLAARYAAKEAVSKALGTGIGPVAWGEIEVVNDDAGRPELVLHGGAADLAAGLGLRQWAISLSHTQDQAIAFVVANG